MYFTVGADSYRQLLLLCKIASTVDYNMLVAAGQLSAVASHQTSAAEI
jgi:hypothetical protein